MKSEEEEEEETPTKATYQLSLASYSTLYRVVVQEMIARASKHVLRDLTKNVSDYLIPYVVAHFHNCLLGGDINQTPSVDIPHKNFYSESELEFTKLEHKDILQLLSQQVFIRFRFTLPENWISESVSLPALFREIAVKYGIQWKSSHYVFTKDQFDAQNEQIKIQVIETKSSSKKSKRNLPLLWLLKNQFHVLQSLLLMILFHLFHLLKIQVIEVQLLKKFSQLLDLI